MRQLKGVDEVLGTAIERGDVPGVVAMAATRDGVIYQGAFGRRVLPEGAVMTADTVFWIASMTKAVTSTAAMQLVEQGKLAFDRPIAGLLPELAAPQVLEGFDAAGEPKLRPARRPITLRHLITHTAGFVYDIWNAEMGRYMERKGVPGITAMEPGSLQRVYLAVKDIDAAREDLISRGVDVSEVEEQPKPPGFPDLPGRSYFAYASFSDPDGNGWLLQEVTTRLPGREWED